MQVSVPGMYQKPAPYSEQTLTYSTALAFTGRSAACAPPTASKAAAEPSTRLLTIFIVKTSKLLSLQKAPDPPGFSPSGLAPQKTAWSLRALHPPHDAGFERTNFTGRSGTPSRRERICMCIFDNQNSLLDQLID